MTVDVLESALEQLEPVNPSAAAGARRALANLYAHTEHLAGALERATVGQQDPVALRLGTRPVDTGPQPAPDLPEMRRLMDARREAGCVAASVWLHDLQWILDRLAQLSADAHVHRARQKHGLFHEGAQVDLSGFFTPDTSSEELNHG